MKKQILSKRHNCTGVLYIYNNFYTDLSAMNNQLTER